MNFVMPSTLYLHSWTVMTGFEADTQSISPIHVMLVTNKLTRTITQLLRKDRSFLNTYTNF